MMRKTRDRSDRAAGGYSPALSRTLALTRAGLAAERGARAFWPVLSVAGAIFTAGAFRLPEGLPDWALMPAGYASVAALAAGLGYGIWKFRFPSRAEAAARLDASLPGRPLAAMADRMALGSSDPAVAALWLRHVERMRAEAEAARPVAPSPDLAPRDPYALRLSALTAVAMAVLFGAPWAGVGMLRHGPAGPAEAAMAPAWEGWAAPPRYTGKPGLYLNTVAGDELRVPKGTRFSFRLYGSAGSVSFNESVSNPAETPEADTAGSSGVTARDFVALRDGEIRIGGHGGRVFRVALLPDAAPEVALVGRAERRADGKFVQPFRASDDYGVVSGKARIALDLSHVDRRYGLAVAPEPHPDLVYDLALPITASRASFTGKLNEDAAKSALANLPVTVTLQVEDGLGQTGSSAPEAMVLPGRRFFDPRAAALIEARRDLMWNRANAPRTAEVLRAISNRPDDIFPDAQTGAAIRAVALRLEKGEIADKTRDDLAEILWRMAVLLEDGGRSDALAKMQQAQQKLSEAMRNGASADEIRKLMQDLKSATDDYLRMLASQDPDQDPRFGANQPEQRITGDQIQQMMDAIQKLMEDGRMAEAQQLLDQLSRMMQNMKVTQGQGGSDNSPGGQSMRDLQETLRNQQQLSDDAFQDMQEGPSGGAGAQPGSPGTGTPEAGRPDPGSPELGGSLADRQRGLRQDLDRQRALMPHLGGDAGAEAQRRLDDAGRAMDEAGRALDQGDTGSAIDRQAEAIGALRDGMKSMREALSAGRPDSAAQDGPSDDSADPRQGAAAGGQGASGRDPLGRQAGEGAQPGTERNMLPGEDVYSRARDLLDELRRRSAERQRPQEELDYLGRLLDRF